MLLWDGEANGKLLGEFGNGKGQVCWYAEMSGDGDTVAAGFGDVVLRLWSASKNKVTELATLDGIVGSLGFSADGSVLFTGNCGDNTVRLWDVAARKQIAAGKTKKSATWMVAVSPQGTRGVSGSADKLVHVWDTHAGKEIGALEGHTGKILGLAFHPDGTRVASASQDKTARLWDVEGGKEIAVLDGHKKQVLAVAFSRDSVRVFRADTGELESTLLMGDHKGAALAFGVSNDEVVVGCEGGEILAIACATSLTS